VVEGLELVVDAHAELGEGPVWDERSGLLWWVDLLGGTVHRTDPVSGTDETTNVGSAIGAVALREDDRLLVAVADGVGVLDPLTKDVELVLPLLTGDPDLRMNDGKVDPLGRFWVGSMSWSLTPGAGVLLRIDPDLSVTPMLTDLTIPNGLDWSDDARSMYYIDTVTSRVDRFAFDIRTGTMSGRQPLVTVPAGQGYPDGMTLDAEGHLWVALFDGWGVQRYSPEGRLEDRIEVPAEQVTSVTFGGRNLEDLYITTGQEDFPPGGKSNQPHAGGLFRYRPRVPGRRANRFAG
jgi:sugar lactone lactonase YvrE